MRRALTLAAVAVVAAGCSADRDTRRFRVPSSSMEPTLHCARPAFGCEGAKMDLVAVHPYGSASRGAVTSPCFERLRSPA